MSRPLFFSPKLLPLALSLGASMLLHGAVVQVWSSLQAGAVTVNPAGVSVLIADKKAGQPEPTATPTQPAPTRTPEQVAPLPEKRMATPVRPVLVSQAISTNIEAPAPRLETVQSPVTPSDKNMLKAQMQEPAPVIREPAYVMGSPQNPEPEYPFVARKFAWEGLVRVAVAVNATGQPQQVEVLSSSGHKVLDQTALETIRDQWLFQPARQNGIAVPGKVIVPVQFALRE